MTFRTSDILIGGSLIIIGLTEIAHLAGCLLGWSFLAVTDLLLAETIVCVPAAVALALICRRRMGKHTGKAEDVADRGSVRRGQRLLTGALGLLVLLQLFRILLGGRLWLGGDMTLETVHTFLKENAIYTANPLTGNAYTAGMPFRIKILCLPTLYGAISRWSGISPEVVIYRLIPCIVLILGYVAYGRLGSALFGKDSVKIKVFLLAVGILFTTGAYMPGVDGFDVLYGGFRGVTIRSAVLLPYLLSCLIDRKYAGAILCILAEACMVWTLYGAGVCLAVTAAFLVLRWIMEKVCHRRKTPAVPEKIPDAPGEGRLK